MSIFGRYLHWLHTRWPAGTVEPLPEADENGLTNFPGVYLVGDLRGIPLLKFALDSGARTVRRIADDPAFQALRSDKSNPAVRDLVILGAGVSGMAAALEARHVGLHFELIETSQPFSTIANFPKAKPIFTYPREMTPAGDLRVSAELKEELLEELVAQTADLHERVTTGTALAIRRSGSLLEIERAGAPPLLARRVIVALGRSGAFRRLNVPGEDLDKVSNRLHDPKDFATRRVLVVGGGDTAVEAAVALAESSAEVTLSHRAADLTRPKPENLEKLARLRPTCGDGGIRILPGSVVREIRPETVTLKLASGAEETIPNDNVFVMIGREAPLGFFRRSGVRIVGEWTPRRAAAFASFLVFCLFLYNWKSGGALSHAFETRGWFPFNLKSALASWASDPTSLPATLATSMSSPSFYYTLAYTLLVTVFGIKRIRRRRTPYVTAQTLTLMAIQILPLFLLPEIILPWLGRNGLLPVWFADAFFPKVGYGHGREYWRAYGFILAWPLFIYNVFTAQPLWAWLGVSVAQTFVLIPGMVYIWGKGAYCGWICSCGALAETLGDTRRHLMPHGPRWNRLNFAGQVILGITIFLFAIRVWGWIAPGSWAARLFDALVEGKRGGRLVNPLNYKWVVDVGLAGVLGVGAYFWFSGRVWCRFFCPLAALMHIYARFSRFGIIAEKKKCISCNVCTSVCHQGIDVMNFANKGAAMRDPECVRCSACVQSCPTGVLTFGQLDPSGNVIHRDRLQASSVQARERDDPERMKTCV